MSMRAIGGVVGAFVVGVVAYLAAWPVPVDPEVWSPPTDEGLTGRFKPTGDFSGQQVLPVGKAPEDVAVGPDGRVWTGLADGRVMRWDADGKGPIEVVNTGGRPLGLRFAPDGRLIVADTKLGLLAITQDGAVEVLANQVDGRPLVFADDLDVSSTGVVWFSDASAKFTQRDYKLDMLESRPNGRLMTYDLNTHQSKTVVDKLYFANGVALAADESFVLFNETTRYRVQRLWLTGPKAGTQDVLIDNLPGFPDGITRGDDGLFWIAIPSPRDAIVDGLAGSPALRKAVVRLPKFVQPAAKRHPIAIAVDASGQVRRVLEDSHGAAFAVDTNVVVDRGTLWMGSLEDSAIARVPLK